MSDDRPAAEPARPRSLTLFARVIRQARPFLPLIVLLFVFDLLATPFVLLTPYPLKLAIDSVLGGLPPPPWVLRLVPARLPLLPALALMMVAIALLQQLQAMVAFYFHTLVGQKLVVGFRARLFRHAQRLSLRYHDTQGMTDSLHRIHWDASSIQDVAIDGLLTFLSAAVTLAGMFWVTARIDPWLAAIAVLVAPALMVVCNLYFLPLRDRYGELSTLERSTIAVLQEVLGAVRVVKAFGKEDHEQERFVRRSNETLHARLKLQLFQGGFDLLVAMIIAVGSAAVLWVGVRDVQAARLTPGELLMVLTYLARIYGQIETLSAKAKDIQASLVSAERAFALLDEEPEVVDRPGARALARARGQLELVDVHFRYGARPVLAGISLTVPAGARVGIAGPTGAGKSTLVSLLARLYDPAEGSVLLDGVDLREYRLADLRNQFAFVLQEPVLFSTSIAENIAYARPAASQAQIVEAARAADAHEFISALPQGYDTEVGERGMMLSGGERQRISIARAFLRDAPILILDEPTSSVDVGTEGRILEAMERLMQGRTTLMIAHRLGTLAGCDLRIRIEQGRLVEVAPAHAAVAQQA